MTARTSWALYAAVVVALNLAGAATIVMFVRFLIPLDDAAALHARFSWLVSGSLVFAAAATAAGGLATYLLFRPLLGQLRRGSDALAETAPAAHVRDLILRMPLLQALVCGIAWAVGIVAGTTLAFVGSWRLGIIVAVTSLIAATAVVLLTFLLTERLLRPLAVRVLQRHYQEAKVQPSIRQRLRLAWIVTSGIPTVGALLLVAGQLGGFFPGDAAEILPALLMLLGLSLVAGFVGVTATITSITDPLRGMIRAIQQLRRGHLDVDVEVYDGSDIGLLQAGFNELLEGLRERSHIRAVFGRYVGADVARHALAEVADAEHTLRGEERRVAVLFVDVVASTSFAVAHPPAEVVRELNRVFERVVAVVQRHDGMINKFEGDAALAVFGAPEVLIDAASSALAAARELQVALRGLPLRAGIGVCAGEVVAGKIGSLDRHEYTVIGDAVNTAARITELAKDDPGLVLTDAATLRAANEVEQPRWELCESVELRGRHRLTQLARPRG